MSGKDRYQKRARAMQKGTGWSYSECLRLAKSEISDPAFAVLVAMRKKPESRVDHRSLHPAFDDRGSCTRCGCSPSMAPSVARRCPPGFWMTPLEAKTWEAQTEGERSVYEAFLCSSPAPGPDTSKGTP